MSATLGNADRAYRAKATLHGYATENPATHLSAQYAANGVEIRFQNAKLGLEFQGWGYGEHVTWGDKAAVATRVKANRVEYRRGSLTEWYVNGPLGIEQGFTILRRRTTLANSRSERLDIALRLRGNLTPSVEAGGHSLTLREQNGADVLRYGPLLAYDASGRKLQSWLEQAGGRLRLRVNTTGARYPVTVDPFVQSAVLSITNLGGAPTYFGASAAVSDDGTVVVAGACGYDPSTGSCTYPPNVVQQIMGDTSTSYNGQAFVFVESGGGWATVPYPQATLTAPDTALGDGFGSAVAISGDGKTIAISAPTHSCSSELDCNGEAYVFVAPSGNESGWATTSNAEILTPSDGASGDYFAQSIGIDNTGSTIVASELSDVAAYRHVDLFLVPAGGWPIGSSANENAWLQPSDEAGFSDNFGIGLAISKDSSTILAGSFGKNSGSGEAYVFQEPTAEAGGWAGLPAPPTTTQETVQLLNSDQVGGSGFGYTVAVDEHGDTLVIGAPYQGGALEEYGEAYVFVEPSAGWAAGANPLTETTRLKPPATAVQYTQFGFDLSISDAGNVVLAGPDNGALCQFSVAAGTPPPWPTNTTLDTPAYQFTVSGVTAGLAGLMSGNASTVFVPSYIPSAPTTPPEATGAIYVFTQGGTTETATISATSGSGQTATVNTAFAEPLVATVVNGNGTAMSGVKVTFTAPANGASGTFAGGVDTATTGDLGTATSAVFTANGTVGSYVVTVNAPNVSGSANFTLTNQAALIATTTTITSTSSDFQGIPSATIPAGYALVGVPVTVNFTVAAQTGSGTPTGTVTVTDGNGDSCPPSATISPGSCSLSFAKAGMDTLTATYTPSSGSGFAPSNSSNQSNPSNPPITVVQLLECSGFFGEFSNDTTFQENVDTCTAADIPLPVTPTAQVLTCQGNTSCQIHITPLGSGVYQLTLSITEGLNSATPLNPLPRVRLSSRALLWLGAFLLTGMMFRLARRSRVQARRCWSALGLLIVVGLLGALPACTSNHGLKPGSYTVNVQFTDGNFQIVVPFPVVIKK